MVRMVLKDYVQVGYFGLAYTVYLNCYVILLTFTNAFVPLLGTLLAKEEREAIKIWVERLIKGPGHVRGGSGVSRFSSWEKIWCH